MAPFIVNYPPDRVITVAEAVAITATSTVSRLQYIEIIISSVYLTYTHTRYDSER